MVGGAIDEGSSGESGQLTFARNVKTGKDAHSSHVLSN